MSCTGNLLDHSTIWNGQAPRGQHTNLEGCSIWTSTAGRLMNPENELPYLKAFGNSIMSEISRVKATKSDIAKTTFIASISHELR